VVSSKISNLLYPNTHIPKLRNGCTRDFPKDVENSQTFSGVNESQNKVMAGSLAPVIPCDVERSFSAYKWILSDRWQSTTIENMAKYLIVHKYISEVNY